MATFVLVHGAWAGAWIWRSHPVAARRWPRRLCHDRRPAWATASTSPTRHRPRHPRHRRRQPPRFEDLTDVTLVGWSYGGMIITGVAERVPERLAQLVYLDADVPADGENSYDAELYSDEARAADRDAAEAAGMPGFLVLDPYVDWIRSLTPDPADQTWLLAKLGAPAARDVYPADPAWEPGSRGDPPRLRLLHRRQRRRGVDPTVRNATRVRSAPGWRYRELADNHLAPVNAPQATAEALLSLV